MLNSLNINIETTTRVVQNYGEILKALQGLAPEAHIAGGAVRDTILHRQIRDVDVFMPDQHLGEVAKLLRTEFGFVLVGKWQQYAQFSDPVMTWVARFERADETIPLCIIGLKSEIPTWRENLERFDFGLCMAAWWGGAMITTDAFDQDAENKTFTLYRADDIHQFRYSMSRFRKMSAERYAGFELSVPQEFEELVKQYSFERDWWFDSDNGKFGMRNEIKPKN
jgi:hypothetical protein